MNFFLWEHLWLFVGIELDKGECRNFQNELKFNAVYQRVGRCQVVKFELFEQFQQIVIYVIFIH